MTHQAAFLLCRFSFLSLYLVSFFFSFLRLILPHVPSSSSSSSSSFVLTALFTIHFYFSVSVVRLCLPCVSFPLCYFLCWVLYRQNFSSCTHDRRTNCGIGSLTCRRQNDETLAFRHLRRRMHGLTFMAAQEGKLTLIYGSWYRFMKQDRMIIQLLRASFAVSFVFTFCYNHIVAWKVGSIIYNVCCASYVVVMQCVSN